MGASIDYVKALENKWDDIQLSIRHQMVSRAFRGSNELRNASQLVLRGQRHGRQYIVPGTGRMTYYKRDSKDGKHKAGTATITYRRYTASAPGEPPAVRTGVFRMSWRPQVYVDHTKEPDHLSVMCRIENYTRTDNGKYLLGEILEHGSPGGKIAPRPHHDRIREKALPAITRIYNEPYV